MVKVGYLRVSTQEQRPDRQVDGLRSRCDRLFVETVSAVRRNRPIYDAVIEDLRPGDTLVVWDLDRAFRSVIDAVSEAERLRAKGVAFEIANLQVDTATPAGMLVYTVMSAFAEFERRTLIQRTKEGLEAARRRGRRLGRPPKLSEKQLDNARTRLAATNDTIAQVARELAVAALDLIPCTSQTPPAELKIAATIPGSAVSDDVCKSQAQIRHSPRQAFRQIQQQSCRR